MEEGYNGNHDGTNLDETDVQHSNIKDQRIDVGTIAQEGLEFLQDAGKPPMYYIKGEKEELPIERNLNGKKVLLACFSIEDAKTSNANALKSSMEAIHRNIDEANKLGINENNLIFIIFINRSNTYFKTQDLAKLKDDDDFLIYTKNFSPAMKNIQCFVIGTLSYSRGVGFHNILYTKLMKHFCSEDHDLTYVFSLSAGSLLDAAFLRKMIAGSYNTTPNSKGCVVVPYIEIDGGSGLFANVLSYEATHFNIYDLNYLDMSLCVPIDSRCYLMRIDKKLAAILSNYFNESGFKNCYSGFLDMNLAIRLTNEGIPVKYSKELNIMVKNPETTYSIYVGNYTNRHGGIFANLFEMLKSILNCTICDPIKKIFLIFSCIGLLFDFMVPSFIVSVAYIAYYDGFDLVTKKSQDAAAVLAIIFAIVFLFSGMINLISRYPTDMPTANFIMFIIFEVYYLFTIIVSVVAMDKLHKKDDSYYKFRMGCAVALPIVNFLVGIVPMLLNISKITSNIAGMFMYLGLGAASSTSHCQMRNLMNFAEMRGGEYTDRKAICIAVVLAINGLIGMLLFAVDNVKQRMNYVIALAAIYTTYNIIKVIAITLKCLVFKSDVDTLINEEDNYPKIKAEIQDMGASVRIKGGIQEKPENFVNDDTGDQNYERVNNNSDLTPGYSEQVNNNNYNINYSNHEDNSDNNENYNNDNNGNGYDDNNDNEQGNDSDNNEGNKDNQNEFEDYDEDNN